MTVYPASLCYLAFLLLALISPFLPLRFIATTVALSALSWSAGRLIEGPTHWSQQNLAYSITIYLLWHFLGIVAAGVSLRYAIAYITGRLNRPLRPDHWAQVRVYRLVLSLALGSVSGLLLMIGLTHFLARSSGGWLLDMAIALLAAGLATAVVRRLPTAKAAPITGLCLTLAVTSAVGSGQSSRIVNRAEAYAKGRPWCLAGPRGMPITSTGQLGFFSLPKAEGIRHLTLWVESNDKREAAHWSIRMQRLDWGWEDPAFACQPREDYGTALRTGQL